MATRYRRFTLLELITVLTTLAVVLALLWPALGRVRRNSLRELCSNNLRQQLIGVALYADDADGVVMPNYVRHEGRVHTWTFHANAEYARDWGDLPGWHSGLGLLAAVQLVPVTFSEGGLLLPDRSEALRCPAAEWFAPAPERHWRLDWRGPANRSRSLTGTYLYRGLGASAWPAGDLPRLGHRLEQVPRRAAVWDQGAGRDRAADEANHVDGYYNVGYYDGAVSGFADPAFAHSRVSPYGPLSLADWFDRQD